MHIKTKTNICYKKLGPRLINLSTDHCIISYFVAHYFNLIVNIYNKTCGFFLLFLFKTNFLRVRFRVRVVVKLSIGISLS